MEHILDINKGLFFCLIKNKLEPLKSYYPLDYS